MVPGSSRRRVPPTHLPDLILSDILMPEGDGTMEQLSFATSGVIRN